MKLDLIKPNRKVFKILRK